MKIEREFFLPYIAGNLGNSLAKAQELHNKLAEFAPIAKVASLLYLFLLSVLSAGGVLLWLNKPHKEEEKE